MIHNISTAAPTKQTQADVSGWTKAAWASGNGYIVEGTVTDKRRHALKVTGNSDLPSRFWAIQIKIDGQILRREYDAAGAEVAPQFSFTEKSMKGYLHHYDKTGAKALNTAPLDEVVGQCKKLINGKLIPTPYSTQLHPAKPNVVEFWADLDKNLTAEFKVGDTLRLKTLGDSVVVETFAVISKSNANTFSAGGSSTLDAWTSKINNVDNSVEEPAAGNGDDDDWE